MTVGLLLNGGELHRLIAEYGYAVVFAFVAVESLGVPLPGETTLGLAAISAGATGDLSIVGVIAAAATGAFVGDNIGYTIGHFGGYPLLRRYGRYLHIDAHRLKVARYLFDRYGAPIVFFGRFVAILRAYAAFLAGTTRMPWRRFVVFNAAGGITWAILFGVLYFYFGTALTRFGTTVDIALAAAAVGAGVAVFVFFRRKEEAFGDAAERAYPDEPQCPPDKDKLAVSVP
jgi:membrane protein DedA with SNARE-associated domain